MKKYLTSFFFFHCSIVFTQSYQLPIDSLNKEWEIAKDDTSRVNALNEICIRYTFTSDYAQALDYGNKALDLAQQVGWKKGTAQSYLNIGTIYQDQSYYPSALDAGLKALKISEDLDDKLLIAKSLDNMGMAYYQQRLAEYNDTALQCYLKSLKLNQELGNKSGIAKNYQNIANLNYKSSEGLLDYDKALNLYQEMKDSDEVARTLWDIAFIYQQVRYDYPKTFEYDFRALKIFERVGDKKGMGSDLWHIGDTYYRAFEDITVHDSLVKTFPDSLLDKTYLFQQSKKYFLQAVSIDSSIGSLMDLKTDYASLHAVYKLTGDYKNSLANYAIYRDLMDSIYSVQSKTQIANLTSKRDADVKQKEIEIQKLQINADLKQRWYLTAGLILLLLSSSVIFLFYKRRRDANQRQKEAELKHQLSDVEMKALRAQMNPHFIFNSLQSIQNFLHQKNPDEANVYLLKFAKLMRMVLENSQYAEVPLEEDLQSLELYMQLESLRLKHPFTYEIKVDESINQEETKIPPLILQPFVENAIWHGLQYKNKSGEIKISIRKTNGALICAVEDNGVGLEVSRTLKTAVPMKKLSLGMKLTEERLKILNELKKVKANFTITGIFDPDNNPSGTRVELSLPC